MLGTVEDPGLIPRSLEHFFVGIGDLQQKGGTIHILASFLEM